MKSSTFLYKLLLIIVVLNFSFLPNLNAQEAPSTFWKNVRYGGGFGLSFGGDYFSATLAPSAIYEFNDQFAAGLGLSGAYRNEKDIYNSTIFGGSILALFNVIPEIQLSAEFEELNENRNYDSSIVFVRAPETNFWHTALFIGAGYRSNYVTVGIRYDVLYEENKSIYGTALLPFIRVYF